MQLAILFWFYRELDVCRNRLALLRLLNPRTRIFGLYGGPAETAATAERRLRGYLDDFYAYPGAEDARWRWSNGDRLIAAWHSERGRRLPWDSIVVVQWDALFLRPMRSLFGMLRPGEALFSGLRPRQEVEAWWRWLKPGKHRLNAENFRARISRRYGFQQDLWCCQFIVACLPRRFLDRYAASGPPREGFLEYKLPTMAKLFGIPFCTDHPFHPWWPEDPSTRDALAPQRTLSAASHEVPIGIVLAEVAAGRIRIIHPYRRVFPVWLAFAPIARACTAFPTVARRCRLLPAPDVEPAEAKLVS